MKEDPQIVTNYFQKLLGVVTWFDFLLIGGIITLVYLVCLWFLILPWTKDKFGDDNLFTRILKYLYWPIASIVLIATFVFVKPIYHGLIVLIVFIFGWKYLKEILVGSFIKFSQLYNLDTKYQFGNKNGKLVTLDMVGGKFKSGDGVQFLTYSQMLDGKLFSLVDDSSSLDLLMTCNKGSSTDFSIEHIQDMIFDCPYVDHFVKPQIKKIDDDTIQFNISTRSMIQEEKLLKYFSNRDEGINFRINHN